MTSRLIRASTKLQRILAELAKGRSLNRFEAERLGDHCLHSTVSAIERRYGILVERCDETVRGFGGNPTRVMRYWLSADELQRAAEKVGGSAQGGTGS